MLTYKKICFKAYRSKIQNFGIAARNVEVGGGGGGGEEGGGGGGGWGCQFDVSEVACSRK